jgi:hypothetical protein
MIRRLVECVVLAVLVSALYKPVVAAALVPCAVAGSPHREGIKIALICYKRSTAPASTTPPKTKTVICGRPSSSDNGLWNRLCGAPRACVRINKATGKQIEVDAFATVTLIDGRWTNPVVWCPANSQPAVDLTALRDQALRLLPTVRIGSAWTTTALVNAETVLWAATTTDRRLPAVTVLGQRIQLRIHFDHADWDFGDGNTDTTTDPGKPYDPTGDPCRTAQCPDYYGHTYTRTGTMTITLDVTWHAQYSLDGTTWTDIAAPITGPVSSHVLALKEARGILVPNPGDH